jgi:hypothetical protein
VLAQAGDGIKIRGIASAIFPFSGKPLIAGLVVVVMIIAAGLVVGLLIESDYEWGAFVI